MKHLNQIIFLFLITGCNIFSPFADESEFSKAQNAYRDGEFSKALELVNNELKNDPLNSNLLYLRTKLNLKVFYDIDGVQGALDLISLVNQFSELDSLATNNAPFYNTIIHPITGKSLVNESNSEKRRIDLLAKTNEIQNFNLIINDLSKIYKQQTHGDFTKQFIESDYAILLAMSGLVELRDTNIDGLVDNLDYYFKLEVSADAATLPLLPDSVLLNSNLAETEIDSLMDMLIFMKQNDIDFGTDTSNFQPKDDSKMHNIFFSNYLLKYISTDLADFYNSITSIKTVFENTISSVSGNEGKIFLGLKILQEIRNTEDDEDFKTLVDGLDRIDDALSKFDKPVIEKEIWDNYIKAELRAIPNLLTIFNNL